MICFHAAVFNAETSSGCPEKAGDLSAGLWDPEC